MDKGTIQRGLEDKVKKVAENVEDTLRKEAEQKIVAKTADLKDKGEELVGKAQKQVEDIAQKVQK